MEGAEGAGLTILDLPDELLLIILRHFFEMEGRCEQKMLKLRLVCQRFARLATDNTFFAHLFVTPWERFESAFHALALILPEGTPCAIARTAGPFRVYASDRAHCIGCHRTGSGHKLFIAGPSAPTYGSYRTWYDEDVVHFIRDVSKVAKHFLPPEGGSLPATFRRYVPRFWYGVLRSVFNRWRKIKATLPKTPRAGPASSGPRPAPGLTIRF